VVKGQSAKVTHKHEAGLVRTGLQTASEVLAARRQMGDLLLSTGEPDYVLIEEQVPVRVELLVGWSHTSLGLAFVFGCGGTGTESIGDTTTIFTPLSEELVRERCQQTVTGRLLACQFPLVLTGVARASLLLAELARQTVDLGLDLDINPLAVTPAGNLVVLDAAFSPSIQRSARSGRTDD
jgi:succinyl-CoA synthetase beta subunit